MGVVEKFGHEEGVMRGEGDKVTIRKVEDLVNAAFLNIWALNLNNYHPHTIVWTTYMNKCRKEGL